MYMEGFPPFVYSHIVRKAINPKGFVHDSDQLTEPSRASCNNRLANMNTAAIQLELTRRPYRSQIQFA